jgi:hypothetical protein
VEREDALKDAVPRDFAGFIHLFASSINIVIFLEMV